MARKCRTKIGTRYYSENQIDRLKFLSEERDRLRKGKLGKEFKSEDEVNAEISKVVNYGIEDVRDSMGNPVLDDIFVYQSDPNTRSVKTSILDRLRFKSYALNEIGVSPKEIWDVYKDKLQAQGISFEEVIYQLRQSPDVPKLNRNTKNSYRTYDTTDNKTMLRDVRNKLLKFKEAFFTREGTTNETFKKVYEMRVNMSDRIKSHSIKTNIKLNRLRKLLDNNNVSEDVRGQLFDSIKDKTIGKVSIPNVTPEVETTINNLINDARLDIDLMTVELQNLGVLDDVRLDILQNNKGEYLTNAYEAYISPDWAKKVQGMPGVIQAAIPEFSARLDNEIDILRKSVDRLNKKLLDPNISTTDRANFEKQKDINEELIKTSLSNKNDIVRYMINFLESLNTTTNEGALNSNGIIKDNIFRQKKDLSPELKAFLGEIKDPIDAISITMGRMAQSYVTRKFQKDLSTFLIDNGLYYFGEYNSEAKNKGWVGMSLDGKGKEVLKQSFGGVDKIWVPQQIKNVIDTYKEIVINKDAEEIHHGDPLAILSNAGGIYKKMATIYNPGGQVVNYVGAASIEFGNGKFFKPEFFATLLDSHINLVREALSNVDKSSTPFAKKLAGRIQYKPSEEWQDLLRVATEAGLRDASVNAEIIDSMIKSKSEFSEKFYKIILDGLSNGDTQAKIGKSLTDFLKGAGGVLKGVDEFMTKSYKLGDEVFKVAHLKDELDLYARSEGSKDFKSITNPEIKNKVESIAKYNTRGEIPNYNEVWGIVKKLKGNPVLGPFPSFRFELIRSNLFSIKLMVQQALSSNPVLEKEALRKFVGKGLLYGAGLFAARLLSNLESGMGSDENEFWREQGLPIYARSGSLAATDDPSIIRVIGIDNYLPVNTVNNIFSPYQDYLDGRIDDFPFLELGRNVLSEYIGTEITTDTALGFLTGKDEWGANIYTDGTGVAKKIGEASEFLVKNVPGLIGSSQQIGRLRDKLKNTEEAISREFAHNGETEKLKVLKHKKRLLEEKLKSKHGSIVGYRTMAFSKNESLTYQFIDRAQPIDKENLKTLYEDKYKSGGYTEESAEDAKAYVEGIYHKNLKKLRAFYYDVSERTTATDPEGILAGKYKFSGLSENYTGDYPLFNKAEIAYITGEVSKEKLPPISLSVAKRVEASYK